MNDMIKHKDKPVWKLNTGNGVPSDLGGFILLKKGSVSNVMPIDTRNHVMWRIDGLGFDYAAYQTTRTKAAKYERVECGNCHEGTNYGPICRATNHPIYTVKCRICNGKSYTMEAMK